MAGTSDTASDAANTAGRNGFLTSTLNVTTLVSIFVVVIFAVVTQLLAASGAVSLSTTLQLTMWLVAMGFIVLLAIAYMFFRVFERVHETGRSSQEDRTPNAETTRTSEPQPDANAQRVETRETQVPPAQKPNGAQEPQLEQDAGSPRNPTQFMLGWSPDGGAIKADDAWVPPDELRHLGGSEYSVSTEQVFPDGCYLVPDSITQVSDTPTGQQVYACRVVDRNPALKDRAHETVVKILADEKPSQASMPPFGWVEFEHLTITPYVTDRNPMWIRYSLRASGLHPAAAPTEREQAIWTVPSRRGVPSEEAEAHVSADDAPSGAAGTS